MDPTHPTGPHLALTAAVGEWTRKGWQVEQMTATGAVLVTRGPNHVVHVIVSVATCGLWLPVWALLALTTRERRTVLGVGEDGQVVVVSQQ